MLERKQTEEEENKENISYLYVELNKLPVIIVDIFSG